MISSPEGGDDVDDPAEIKRRLRLGSEVTPGEAARVLGVSRGTVHNMVKRGKLRYRRSDGGWRRLLAEDVLAKLGEQERVHRWPEEEPPPEPEE